MNESRSAFYRAGLHVSFLRQAGILAVLSLLSVSATGQDLSASLADPAWTGEGIPAGQQCQRFGGQNSESPEVTVQNIPAGTEAIVLAFSGRSLARMDNGGHGQVAYKLSGDDQASVTAPSVPGHTNDLPEGFFVVQEHQAPNRDKAGAYLPPCSGGRGNDYFIDIKAVKLEGDQQVGEVLGETSVKLATY
jgi:hypothetical protein